MLLLPVRPVREEARMFKKANTALIPPSEVIQGNRSLPVGHKSMVIYIYICMCVHVHIVMGVGV